MKDKLMSIFVAFVRKTFTKERLLDLIDDLLDIVYDRLDSSRVDERFLNQSLDYVDARELDKNDV